LELEEGKLPLMKYKLDDVEAGRCAQNLRTSVYGVNSFTCRLRAAVVN